MKPNIFNLTLKQLRLAAAIAEHGQLQRAASILALTQPAASRMLSEIEKIVGAPLFERTSKGMTLTPMGRILARHAHAMTVEMHDLSSEVEQLHLGRSGNVRVGSVTGPAVGYLVPAIWQLRGLAPDAKIAVEVAPSAALMRGLMSGDFDFVIARLPTDLPRRDFVLHPAGTETVSFLTRRDHPLATLRDIPLTSLTRHEWIIQEHPAPIRQAVEEAMALRGALPPANIITTSSVLLMMALLAESNAIAPLAQEVVTLFAAPQGAGFASLDLAEPVIVPPYYLIEMRNRTLSSLAVRLKALLLSELKG
ncbi:LysR family transcriptional regulator [Falsirhodobacter sp. 1013]|uniref:LysR family transcriptional regulator n=1 Tax=Falsirhodobacter sp. 1013 TaxID=3417566 RepID=UPI003EBE02AE